MSLLKIEEDQYGYHHHRFQQMYKGLKIEGAEYMVHEKDKYVVKANGKLIPDLNINTRATISKDKAFRLALEHVDAKTYLWQNQKEEELIKRIRNDINATYFPEGELVITPAKGTLSNNIDDFRLAYRFDIYTDDPPDANAVYIDAQQGTVLKTQTLVMSCVSGTGCTLYNSPPNQSINTQFDNGQYNLYDDCRGGGIHTVLNGNDVYKTTNNWTATSDCPVVSTHWGSEVTYDYFSNIHNRKLSCIFRCSWS